MTSSSVTNKLTSEIYQVLVYQRQARVTRIVDAAVSSGNQQLIITGIPNSVDTSTIQVKGKGDFTILGIRYEQKELIKADYPAKLKELSDAVDTVDEKLAEIEGKLYLLKQEEDFLNSNQNIGGTQTALTVEQMREMSNFMSQGFSQLVSNRQKANKAKKQLEADRIVLWNEFEERLDLYERSSTEVLLDIAGGSDSKAVFTIDYVVGGAGWFAEYDVRASSDAEQLKISYKAKVFQNTGESWYDVKLILSSGNPSLNNTKPTLNPWFIHTERPMPAKPKMMKKSVMRSAAPLKESLMSSMHEFDAEEITTNISDSVYASETAINISYEIDINYNIPSNNEPIAINLLEFNPKSEFSYSAVPKMDNCAFLTASVLEWDISNLLSGDLNIYLDEAFVGKTYLNTKSTEENILISLGRDERIQVSREQLKHLKSGASFIGNKKKEQFDFQIKVKNASSKKITLKIEDNLPVSKDNDIQVKLGEVDGATFDEKRGMLKWEISPEPGASKKLEFDYNISYPKDKPPLGLF